MWIGFFVPQSFLQLCVFLILGDWFTTISNLFWFFFLPWFVVTKDDDACTISAFWGGIRALFPMDAHVKLPCTERKNASPKLRPERNSLLQFQLIPLLSTKFQFHRHLLIFDHPCSLLHSPKPPVTFKFLLQRVKRKNFKSNKKMLHMWFYMIYFLLVCLKNEIFIFKFCKIFIYP